MTKITLDKRKRTNIKRLPDLIPQNLQTSIDKARLLIVCEGRKTEPNYFTWLLKKWNLTTVQAVAPIAGSAAISVVDYAVERKKLGDFDEVWCVFDREKFSENTSFTMQ